MKHYLHTCLFALLTLGCLAPFPSCTDADDPYPFPSPQSEQQQEQPLENLGGLLFTGELLGVVESGPEGERRELFINNFKYPGTENYCYVEESYLKTSSGNYAQSLHENVGTGSTLRLQTPSAEYLLTFPLLYDSDISDGGQSIHIEGTATESSSEQVWNISGDYIVTKL